MYGKGSRDFWVAEDLLIAANEKDDTVCFISAGEGTLLRKLHMKSPLCVLLDKIN